MTTTTTATPELLLPSSSSLSDDNNTAPGTVGLPMPAAAAIAKENEHTPFAVLPPPCFIVYEERQHALPPQPPSCSTGLAQDAAVGATQATDLVTLGVADLFVIDRTTTFAAAELRLREHLQKTLPPHATVTWEHDDIPPSSVCCSVTYGPLPVEPMSPPVVVPVATTTTTSITTSVWTYLFGGGTVATPSAAPASSSSPTLNSTTQSPSGGGGVGGEGASAAALATTTTSITSYPKGHRFGILPAPSAVARLCPPLVTGGPPIVVLLDDGALSAEQDEIKVGTGGDERSSDGSRAEMTEKIDDNWFLPVPPPLTGFADAATAEALKREEEEEFVTVPDSNCVPPLHTSNLIIDTPPEADGFVTVTTVHELTRATTTTAPDDNMLLLMSTTDILIGQTVDTATSVLAEAVTGREEAVATTIFLQEEAVTTTSPVIPTMTTATHDDTTESASTVAVVPVTGTAAATVRVVVTDICTATLVVEVATAAASTNGDKVRCSSYSIAAEDDAKNQPTDRSAQEEQEAQTATLIIQPVQVPTQSTAAVKVTSCVASPAAPSFSSDWLTTRAQERVQQQQRHFQKWRIRP